tara:strand:+ start:216 stop:749 length:534 start_codon:yes stop_codon:yes gene_type:complete
MISLGLGAIMQPTFFNALAITVLLLAGCAETPVTKASPKGWLDALTKTAEVGETADALIPRKQLKIFRLKAPAKDLADQPIDRIVQLVVDPVPGGVLITATGETAKTGSYNGQLTTLDSAVSSILEYQFDVFQPPGATPGTGKLRRITIAKFLTEQNIVNISLIRVHGTNNVMTVRP